MEPTMTHSPYFTDYLTTPIGEIYIEASELGIRKVLFISSQSISSNANKWTEQCKQELMEYFSGKRTTFTLPLDQIGTEFQHKVWQDLINIPFGKTSSYAEVANNIQNPKAVRAVGAANGKNPISIIVPCHRVIGSNKKLTGYAGGLERKAWLLKHEDSYFLSN